MSKGDGFPQDGGWYEYRRLVLAELERLNDCIEKLRAQDDINKKENHEELLSIIQESTRRLTDQFTSSVSNMDNQIRDLYARIQDLENANKDGLYNQINDVENKKSVMAFWTAVITIAGSLIMSLISLYQSATVQSEEPRSAISVPE